MCQLLSIPPRPDALRVLDNRCVRTASRCLTCFVDAAGPTVYCSLGFQPIPGYYDNPLPGVIYMASNCKPPASAPGHFWR